jgi:hypothetical protein
LITRTTSGSLECAAIEKPNFRRHDLIESTSALRANRLRAVAEERLSALGSALIYEIWLGLLLITSRGTGLAPFRWLTHLRW